MHPNGQIPAYEWNFGDVNPPVDAWATIFSYRLDKTQKGEGDTTGSRAAFKTAPELHVAEELLVSVAGTLEDGRDLPDDVEGALRDGLQEAIDAEKDAGRLNTVTAWVLSQTAGHAPVDWIMKAVDEIGPRVI